MEWLKNLNMPVEALKTVIVSPKYIRDVLPIANYCVAHILDQQFSFVSVYLSHFHV